jgi:DNA-binding transcriptional regulator YdaS (Cro superfamily)
MSRQRTPAAGKAAIKKAVDHIGSQSEVARQLGIWQSAVAKWVRTGKVSAQRAIDLERITEGAVTRAELRPDLWAA